MIASSRRSVRQIDFVCEFQRESIESKRDGLMEFDKSVCAEIWDSIGSQNFFLGFWTIVAEEWVHGAESESLSTHGFWSASFPAFQQKERASENKDTYLPRDRAQVHRFLLNGNWTSKEEVGAGGSWVGGCVWGKMLEEQLAYYLEKYLGNYVQGLSKEALKVSVWQGMYVYI